MSIPPAGLEIASIPLGLVRRYLVARGWRIEDGDGDGDVTAAVRPDIAQIFLQRRAPAVRTYELYTSPIKDYEGIELVVPLHRDRQDYAAQISRVVSALAAVEDRTEEQVLFAIREIGFDVVRSRVPDKFVVDDTIHLEVARNYLSGIRDVLASTATTEIEPGPFFLRVKKEATEYADRCRFGHTFRGSFGFTVESPVGPLQPGLPGLDAPTPFERRVVQRVARGIITACQAVKEDDLSILIDPRTRGFSANAFEHFANLIEHTTGAEITFDFSFSPEWALTDPEVGQAGSLTVGLPHIEVSRAAAKALRASFKPFDATVFGRVVRLASDVNPSDLTDIMGEREVAILWSSEVLGDITVRASLTPQDYLLALDAHAAGRPIEISGTVDKRGRSWTLLNPVGLSVSPPDAT